MIRKFVDEFNNTYIFIQADEKIILWLNGQCEYTINTIISLPNTLKEAQRIAGLNIWYPMEDITESII